MSAKYIVTNGMGADSKPFDTFQQALGVAVLEATATAKYRTVVNLDGIDVCEDSDCQQCNRDGLTKAEREALDDAGLS